MRPWDRSIILTDYPEILQALIRGGVEFIVIGGVAGIAHGAARLTLDVDVVYRRTLENYARIEDVFAPIDAIPRGAPIGLPFRFDRETIKRGLNFTLRTKLGDIDLLGEVTGGGSYDDLLPYAVKAAAFGVECWCLDLPMLIQVKRAAGRPKDFEAIAELEAILEERGGL